MDIAQTLRQTIEESPLPLHRIAMTAGIDPTNLWKFKAGKTEKLRIDTLNKLLPVLGLKIVASDETQAVSN